LPVEEDIPSAVPERLFLEAIDYRILDGKGGDRDGEDNEDGNEADPPHVQLTHPREARRYLLDRACC
jgi:hypothetical protein